MENKFVELKQLQNNAYCKYSNFRVASIIKTDVGEFKGVNVENGAYGSTICAERNAICSAITHGAKKVNEVHLLTDGMDCNLSTPCGECRQVMSEFMDKDGIVYVYDQNENVKEFKLKELLPNSFNL